MNCSQSSKIVNPPSEGIQNSIYIVSLERIGNMTKGRLLSILKSFDKNKSVDVPDIINKLEEENQILRKFLWLNHGCESSCLYGDDGEMQCGRCIFDFKRGDVKKILEKLSEKNMGEFIQIFKKIEEEKTK